MPSKTVTLPELGEITLVKRRSSRSLRMSFTPEGTLRVSLPYWVPYRAGIDFAQARQDWIAKHRPTAKQHISHGDRIGKAHRIEFAKGTGAKTSVRVSITKIIVTHPVSSSIVSSEVQKAVERGALKALKKEADQLLPQRLSGLAAKHGFTYSSVSCKRLSSRWGSCSQAKDIILNTYLMQLPWELIDYVILHELVHTEHLNHGEGFWTRFEQVLPDAKARRKLLKTHKTAIVAAGQTTITP